MRTSRCLAGLLAVSVVASITVGACGSDDTTAPATPVGNELTYDSFGTRAGIDCADGRSLTIGGSNNTITVTGTCTSVTVSGADNKIQLDRVEQSLTVTGLNNTVVYVAGDPDVVNRGTGNDIRKD